MDPMQPTLWVCPQCDWSHRPAADEHPALERVRHEQRTGHVTTTVRALVERSHPRTSFPPIPTDAADLAAHAAQAFSHARSCLGDLAVLLGRETPPELPAGTAVLVHGYRVMAEANRKRTLRLALQLLATRTKQREQERAAAELAEAKGEVKP
ncbi:hypothetical protein [Corallococcus sp. EGB]|uniref:hypothetical protein n=1 Tax=Corallococcus sp. EGB TaxID=1521117 RepID=UPI001CBCF5E6|nr:hypothetical protein [Corallococcus sp. EGB]